MAGTPPTSRSLSGWHRRISLASLVIVALVGHGCGGDGGPDPRIEELGRCTDFNPTTRNAYFGDTHVHGPEGVNFYTRGKVVTTRWGVPAELGTAPSSLDLHFPTNR